MQILVCIDDTDNIESRDQLINVKSFSGFFV
ncbi:hypothetical protein SMWOGL2_05310 [Sporomusa malonica]